MSKSYCVKLFCFIILFVGVNAGFAQPQIYKSGMPTWLRGFTKKLITPDFNEISLGYYFEQSEYQVNVG